ncbi:Protein of unknown function [Bacillus mycoides]|nr:Protein of unknown function [Bacillus mycoides]
MKLKDCVKSTLVAITFLYAVGYIVSLMIVHL